MSHYILFSWLQSSFLTTFSEPWRYIISEYCQYSSALTIDQRFSIGFKSREFGGNSITVKACCSVLVLSQLIVAFAWWGKALSCWKITLLMPFSRMRLMNSLRFYSNSWIYIFPLTVPSIKTSGPSLLPMKHPHTICDNPTSFSSPWIFCGTYFSSLVWCQNTSFWRPSLFFLKSHSSENNIDAKSSRVRCRCSLAH